MGWFKTKSKSINKKTVNVDVLCRVASVSDEYWRALYQPVIDTVERCFNVLAKSNEYIDDYTNQSKRIILKSKGEVQSDQIQTHVFTYSLFLAFTAIYVSKITSNFTFIRISPTRDRDYYYPWITDIKIGETVTYKQNSHIQPIYVNGLSFLSQAVPSVGLSWLHNNSTIMKGLYQAVMTGGEEGIFSSLIATVNYPLNVQSTTLVSDVDKHVENDETKPSLDDLISGLDSKHSTEDVNVDDIIKNQGKEIKAKNVVNRLESIEEDAKHDATLNEDPVLNEFLNLIGEDADENDPKE
jgi:hypothetical protein